jgi:hypothetical protein
LPPAAARRRPRPLPRRRRPRRSRPPRARRCPKTVEKGKVADLALVDGDPRANISDVRKLVSAVRAGVVFPAKETFATVGVQPWE